MIKKLANIRSGVHVMVMSYLVLSCTTPKMASTLSPEINVVKFRTNGRVPVVDAYLNGKKALFIVDTGASVSVVNESEASYYNFRIHNNSHSNVNEVLGFGGTSTLNLASNCKVELGSLKIENMTFKSKNLAALASAICENETVRFAGILGGDVLHQYHMNIDFGSRTISCQRF